MATAWRGLFSSFKDAISDTKHPTDPWKDEKWIKYVPRKLKNHLDSPLPIIPHVLKYCDNTRDIYILDIGGNTGSHFDLLGEEYDPYINEIHYYCIDNEYVCEIGKQLNPSVKFYSNLNDLPTLKSNFNFQQHFRWDIIYLNSTLQYIEDWKSLLQNLQNLKNLAPDYFIFERLSVTTNPTFVTLQTDMDGYEVPYRFINEKEFIDTFLSMNNEYQLIYRCKSEPLDDRLDGLDWPVFTSNLIFVRK